MNNNKKNDLLVSIIIPNYNGLSLLDQNLTAVLAAMRKGDELIIIDDASSDQSVAYLIKKFKINQNTDQTQFKKNILYETNFVSKTSNVKIKLLIHQQNQRFAQSCNHGAVLASNPLIFLLNNDVRPQLDIFKFLIPYFQPNSFQFDQNTFAVSCLEIEENLDNLKGGKNHLWFEKGLFQHCRSKNFQSGETAWASGGSALFDRQKWLKLAGFKLNYRPAYWEDIDLSYRARKKGWKIFFEEKAVVYHNHQSTNIDEFGEDKIKNISWQNADKFSWNNGNIWQKIAFLIWRPYWWWKRSI